ncbi:E3 SUMO-protein ligase NSE2 [Xylocopa sonorina]|uniref:E3 SUMO-protein ligase NSE2 n=1 Tax=Xylocopa sonorina TaxID=1818115 RepID=UPI00403B3523
MTQTQQIVEELYDFYTKTVVDIITYYEADEREEKLKELRDIVENNCIQRKKLQSAEDIKKRILELYEDDDKEHNIALIIEEYNNAILEISTDVSKDSKLVEFDKHVEILLDKIPHEDNSEDVELQCSGGYMNFIDPISKKRIIDPVKNTKCGHTYDRESITGMLKINNKTRCPVVGCKSTDFVTLSHLRPDIVMKAYLEKNPQ